MHNDNLETLHIIHTAYSRNSMSQARAEGGAVGAWAPAPFPLDAQSALFCQGNFYFYFFIFL